MPHIHYLPFRRQFYLGAQPMLADASWKQIQLKNGLYLSYSAYLPVQFINKENGDEYILLGDAVESLVDKPTPVKSLQTLADVAQLPHLYQSWSGRWVLIANNELHLDASGLLGCFYHNKDGKVAVSSVAGFLSGEAVPNTFRLIKVGGAEFYPPPDAGFKGISKLLPSQILNLSTGEVRFRNLQIEVPRLTYNQTIAYLAQLLCTTLKNIAAQNGGKKLLLALTGGFDSRVLMAALQHSQIPYETVTFHFPNIRPSDAAIPKKLSRICGVPHRLIRRRERCFQNWETFNLHTSGHSVEMDREYMLYQQFNELEGDNTLLLRGGGFEVGRCAYYPWLPATPLDGFGISTIQKGNEVQARSWNRWLDWITQTPGIKLDWRDRYYIEQRLAGWLSSTEQGLDMVNIERQIPANSTLFYNVMLQLPEHIRKTKVQMTDLIRYLAPQLLQVPINPPVGFYYKQYRRILFKVNRLKQKLNWA